jgi:hypothetical protein
MRKIPANLVCEAVGVVVLHRMGMKVALDLGYPRFQSEKDLGP